jgi:prevent-host-death family protein
MATPKKKVPRRSARNPAAAAPPDVVREKRGWGVRPAGAKKSTSVHARRADAVVAAAEAARGGGAGPLRVGVFEVKTNLSGLLERVAAGETVVITRHDRPIAKLAPFDDEQARVDAAVERLRNADFGARLAPGESLEDFLKECRR